jgi:hypothetical protein
LEVMTKGNLFPQKRFLAAGGGSGFLDEKIVK